MQGSNVQIFFSFYFLIEDDLFLCKKEIRDFHVRMLRMMSNFQKSSLEKNVRMDVCVRPGKKPCVE